MKNKQELLSEVLKIGLSDSKELIEKYKNIDELDIQRNVATLVIAFWEICELVIYLGNTKFKKFIPFLERTLQEKTIKISYLNKIGKEESSEIIRKELMVLWKTSFYDDSLLSKKGRATVIQKWDTLKKENEKNIDQVVIKNLTDKYKFGGFPSPEKMKKYIEWDNVSQGYDNIISDFVHGGFGAAQVLLEDNPDRMFQRSMSMISLYMDNVLFASNELLFEKQKAKRNFPFHKTISELIHKEVDKLRTGINWEEKDILKCRKKETQKEKKLRRKKGKK